MASVSDRNTDARGKPGTERTEKNFLPLQPIKDNWMLRDVAPTMNKVSHRMGSVQGGHEGNIPVEGHALLYCYGLG